ncbi:MAG: IS110 family transposase [Bacteroidota bacterium]
MKRARVVIGIDIGSESVSVAVMRSIRQKDKHEQKFNNTGEGFEELHRWLHSNEAIADESVVVMEATGVYGEALSYFLCSRGYSVAVEPPLKVKRAFQYSAHKNDTVDARQIAEYGHRFFDELQYWSPPDGVLEQVRELLSAREQFTTQKIANSNALKALQRKIITSVTAIEAYELAIDRLKQNIEAVDKEIKRLEKNDDSFHRMITRLTSTPGIGMLLAANLIVITRGFSKTQEYKEIASFAGVSPVEHTSGTSIFRKARSRRFGPHRLRKLLYLSAMSAATHNEEFRKYYLRKVAEGKPKRLVLNNVANKLLKIVCAIVKSETDYIPNYRSVNPWLLKVSYRSQ